MVQTNQLSASVPSLEFPLLSVTFGLQISLTTIVEQSPYTRLDQKYQSHPYNLISKPTIAQQAAFCNQVLPCSAFSCFTL